jgi:flagellin-like protein
MRIESRNDRAVSPIIGGIMMVGITVILSAVIAAFVMGMAGGVSDNVQAGVTIHSDPGADEIKVVWTANQNAEYLEINACGPLQTMDDVGRFTVAGCGDEQVDIVVTAVNGEDRTVIISKSIDLRG